MNAGNDAQIHFRVVRFIYEAGIKLHQKSVPLATAAVIYHKFYRENSIQDYDPYKMPTTRSRKLVKYDINSCVGIGDPIWVKLTGDGGGTWWPGRMEKENEVYFWSDDSRLSNYENRSTNMDSADTALMGDLTETEKALLGSQEIVKIQGKAGHIVPVLIPPDVSKPLAYLVTKSVRNKAEVKDDNLYVFGNTGNSAYRAYDALKRACVEAEVTCPDRITSVNLRKYFATMTQVIGMNDNEIKWICKHMGHSVDVHQLHYRATSGYIERINIGKLMLLQDLNVVGKFKGKKIEEIHVEDILKESESEQTETDPTEQHSKSGQVLKNLLVQPQKLIATTCLYLAGKIEEEHTSLRDIINVCYRSLHKTKPPLEMGSTYWSLRDSVAMCELFVLRMLNFKVIFVHPHKYLLHYLKFVQDWFEPYKWQELAISRTAWALLKDSYHGTLCLKYKPQHIAVAVLYFALQCHQASVPYHEQADTPWWKVFAEDLSMQTVRDIVSDLIDIYDFESASGS